MQGVLFDLDGTLLDIDMGSFLDRYFSALARAMAPLTDGDESLRQAMRSLSAATTAMMLPHAGRTNQEVFADEFHLLTGIDIDEHAALFDRFYAEEFSRLGEGYGPTPGSRRVVETALDLGLKVAIATNPIFPRAAVEHRIAWAGLADLDLHAVTAYESMHACKPLAAYFLETAELIDVSPERSLMVGDDADLDLPASATGMRTFYVGSRTSAQADHRGDLNLLADMLGELVRDW
ncbi:MAG: HAD family hydrolase [Coriobacteriia bacterium]|nr:HAD family hydrolase [Coriobacteriia bacterium]